MPRRKISDFGPAISSDGGKSWKWLYDRAQGNDSTFTYSFGKNENEVRFSIGMAYLEEDFNEFIAPSRRNKNLTVGSLTVSSKGRSVEKLLIHNPETPVRYKMVITARHHACEMMASYVLDGDPGECTRIQKGSCQSSLPIPSRHESRLVLDCKNRRIYQIICKP